MMLMLTALIILRDRTTPLPDSIAVFKWLLKVIKRVRLLRLAIGASFLAN